MSATNVRLIRIDAIVPQTKAAIREALEAVPENIMLIRPADERITNPDRDRIIYLADLKPGESVAFTDGAGKYYGTITRNMAGGPEKSAWILDAKK